MRTVAPAGRRLATALSLTTAAVFCLAACGSSSGDQPVAAVSGPSPSSAAPGTVPLNPPDPKPDLTLTDQHGHSYNLAEQTSGRPTLLYFGYTHCPDVCPTTMADIAGAASKLPTPERKQLRVVFVSTDPDRDTPQRLSAWLGAIDPGFIGLTGDFRAVQTAASSLACVPQPPRAEIAAGCFANAGGGRVPVRPATHQLPN